jgi:hypothetical protein
MEDYSQILDRSSFAQFQQDLQEMQLILVATNQLIKIPREPPGPCFVAKEISSNLEELSINSKSVQKYMLLVLQDEDLEKQSEALYLIERLTGKNNTAQFQSEDEIVN